jgi:hypothetical protein
MDSFSFLQHPVHQRSLEILQRCKEEKYSKAANPDKLCVVTFCGNGNQEHSTPEWEVDCISSMAFLTL